MPDRARYTKTQVRRAGRLWAELIRAHRADPSTALDRFRPDEVFRAEEILSWWRSLHADPLRAVNANLRYYVRDHSEAEVTQRLKKHATIVDKLLREPTMDLTRMEDIGGVRLVVEDLDHADEVVRRLRRNWAQRITRYRDYVAEPKPDGYRAHHLIVEQRGFKIEVQVRSRQQDMWANTVEYDSRRVGTDLKSGHGPAVVHQFYRVMSDYIAHEETGRTAPNDLVQRLTELYAEATPYLRGAEQEPPS